VDKKTTGQLFRAEDRSFEPDFTTESWARTVKATEATVLKVGPSHILPFRGYILLQRSALLRISV
jgi:hypothetical protein